MKKISWSETTSPRALIFGMQHHLVDIYQICSNKAPGVNNGPTAGVTLAYIKSTFSGNGHVAYQTKGNEAYNNMLNILP